MLKKLSYNEKNNNGLRYLSIGENSNIVNLKNIMLPNKNKLGIFIKTLFWNGLNIIYVSSHYF